MTTWTRRACARASCFSTRSIAFPRRCTLPCFSSCSSRPLAVIAFRMIGSSCVRAIRRSTTSRSTSLTLSRSIVCARSRSSPSMLPGSAMPPRRASIRPSPRFWRPSPTASTSCNPSPAVARASSPRAVGRTLPRPSRFTRKWAKRLAATSSGSSCAMMTSPTVFRCTTTSSTSIAPTIRS